MTAAHNMQGPLETMAQQWEEMDPNKLISKFILSDRQFRFIAYITVALRILNSYSTLFKTDGVLSHRGPGDIMNMIEHLKIAAFTLDKMKTDYADSPADAWGLHYSHEAVISAIRSIQAEFNFEEKDTLFLKTAIFHPKYKGKLLLSDKDFKNLIKEICQNHPSTEDFREKKKESELKFPIDIYSPEELGTMKFGERLKLEIEAEQNRVQKEKDIMEMKTPIEKEFQDYLEIECDDEQVDPLLWWKKKEQDLPIISKLAREFLAIPFACASASRKDDFPGLNRWQDYSEEMGHTAKLLFIQGNYGRLPTNYKDWNCKQTVKSILYLQGVEFT